MNRNVKLSLFKKRPIIQFGLVHLQVHLLCIFKRCNSWECSVHFFRGPWFRDDGSLMILIRESENNSELFLSPRPRRNNELRRLHYAAQSDVATVSTCILRLILVEERNMSPAQLHQFQPLFRRLRALVLRLTSFS